MLISNHFSIGIFLASIFFLSSLGVVISYAEEIYTTPLVGFEEVPPVPTNSSGFAVLKYDNKTLNYQINVTNLDKIKSSHIHIGAFGENGDVIATLFNSSSPTGLINGTLTQGTITTSDLEGPFAGKSLQDVIAQIKQLKAYINVHTVNYPNGEIRGQIANATAINATAFS
ncbi:MAG TPA: CHRD domain-containing protein [Nitrososphaeraceae archaeon]|nr:CHRD domain-containing protein [Nitrososphaeraceae archaeon]